MHARRPVATAEDLHEPAAACRPEYTHQLFGEQEKIFGYKGLAVKVFYAAGDLTIYVGCTYSDQYRGRRDSDPKPDDVLGAIGRWLPTDQPAAVVHRLADFEARLAASTTRFVPHGDLVHVYRLDDEPESVDYAIYKATSTTPGFAAYHARMQTLLVWFIEAASYVDITDPAWTVFSTYRRSRDGGTGDTVRHELCAFTTLYDFYAYPSHVRSRLSQILVWPRHRKRGHGARLLQAVYRDVRARPEVIDVTVEDPNEPFTAMRDLVDLRECLREPELAAGSLPDRATAEPVEQLRRRLKIARPQFARIYEMLLAQARSPRDPDAFRRYRLAVKTRLYREDEDALGELERNARYAVLEQRFRDVLERHRALVQRARTLV